MILELLLTYSICLILISLSLTNLTYLKIFNSWSWYGWRVLLRLKLNQSGILRFSCDHSNKKSRSLEWPFSFFILFSPLSTRLSWKSWSILNQLWISHSLEKNIYNPTYVVYCFQNFLLFFVWIKIIIENMLIWLCVFKLTFSFPLRFFRIRWKIIK